MTIIEERCYVLHSQYGPKDYLDLYVAEGLEVQTGCLGDLVGYFSSEVGELNAVLSLWRYTSFEDRMRRRAALAADPRWQVYLARIRPMIRTMKNRLLLPAAFSPIQ